ncbi:MAG: hypothetical protein ACK55B_10590, partial [Cyanobacteriota bacterium]
MKRPASAATAPDTIPSRVPSPAPTAAEAALAAMRASVFGTDPMAPAPPVIPSITAPSNPKAPVHQG